MPSLSITAFQDREASVISVAAPDGRNAAAPIRATLLSEGSRFAATFGALYGAFVALAEQTAPLTGRLLPEALIEEIRKLVARIVATRYRDAAGGVQQAKRDDAARIARINETPAQLPLAAEDRAEFRSLDTGGRAKWIARADRSQLAALIVAGRARFPGLPDELWNEIIERHAVLAHVEKSGLQANFQLQPTPDHPANVGPDLAAAEAATREAMREWRDEQRAIDDAENALRSVIVAIAVATDLSVGEAFKLLNGEAA